MPPFIYEAIRVVASFFRQGVRRFRTQGRLMLLAILVGITVGLLGVCFFLATEGITHYALGVAAGYHPEPRPAGEPSFPWPGGIRTAFQPWMLLALPTIGGLVSGILIYWLAPEAEGHGTDAVISAYHHNQGIIRPRVPLVKIIASALTIGTGGSGGREGPIAQIGAGFGSFLSDFLKLRPVERRILMVAGMGAGVAAVFRAPLAGALFAAEVLYSSQEFESDVIIPAGLASVISYCTFGICFGWTPLFSIPEVTFSGPLELIPYLILAVFMVILASIFVRTFEWFTSFFHRLKMPRFLKPAFGALLTGGLALALYFSMGRNPEVLSVLSFGYSALQHAMNEAPSVAALTLLVVAFGKILTTSLTIGSGGSGGVFGPSMVIGGCSGGALGLLLHHWFPDIIQHPASFVVVGMAGFFAAAAKTPFSTLVIVSEMTGGYHLLLPALWVCMIAYLLSDKKSIYSSQVFSRAFSPAHQGRYVREVLANVHVGRFLATGKSATPVMHLEDRFATVLDTLDASDYPALPVVDSENRLQGVVNLEEVHLTSQASHIHPWILAADIMRTDITPLTPHDRLDRALELFSENDLLALPVVSDFESRVVIGVVRRFDILNDYLRRVHGLSKIESE